MTLQILLIRHAAHSHLGTILSGRTPGIALSTEGEVQAATLVQAIGAVSIDAIHASPVQRAQETARAIAASRRDMLVETVPALDELDFGDWAGRAFVELASDSRWGFWNDARETATAPGGESMVQAQVRAWRHIEQTAAALPERIVAMVTHCDIIRAVIAKALGLRLNDIHNFDVAPASVSRLIVGPWGAKVLSLNEISP